MNAYNGCKILGIFQYKAMFTYGHVHMYVGGGMEEIIIAHILKLGC